MGNNLYCGAQIFSAAFFVQHIPEDFSGCQVGVLIQIFIDKPFIVSKIQISFSAVFRNIDFTVLIRAHRSGINIDIGVELLRRHFQAAHFKEPSQRSCCNSLSKSRHHSACDEDVFCHSVHILSAYKKGDSDTVVSETPLPHCNY